MSAPCRSIRIWRWLGPCLPSTYAYLGDGDEAERRIPLQEVVAARSACLLFDTFFIYIHLLKRDSSRRSRWDARLADQIHRSRRATGFILPHWVSQNEPRRLPASGNDCRRLTDLRRTIPGDQPA